MAGKFTDSERMTGRRGFFRELLVSAIEGVEKAGRHFAEQRFGHFQQPTVAPPPTPDYQHHLRAQYTVYGPPWPPPYGPCVSIELRKKLDASLSAARANLGESVPRD
jgi:hypothetical protein